MPDIQRGRRRIDKGISAVVQHSGYAHTRAYDGPGAQSLAELGVHHRTLSRCQVCLKHYFSLIAANGGNPNAHEEAVEETMLTGLIVEYARTFGSGPGQLDPKSIFDSGKESQRHEWFMTQRSKHLAHDVNGWRDCKIGILFDDDFVPQHLSSAVSQSLFAPFVLEDFSLLVDKALAYTIDRIQAESNSLIRTIARLPRARREGLPPLELAAPPEEIKRSRRPSKRSP